MRDAVIVSTARTAIGKAYRGGFNATLGPTLGSYSLKAAVERAGIEGGEIDDVLWGSALQQGTQGGNLARQVALRAGLPVSVSGMTMDRQCSSGLMSIATAAKHIIVDNVDVMAAGGQESISLVQTKEMRVQPDRELVEMHNSIYMPMLQTAEVVAKRYNIGRDAMDKYALQSQQRTAAAQAAGYFDAEIVPVTTMMNVVNKETGEVSHHEFTLTKDEVEGVTRGDGSMEGECLRTYFLQVAVLSNHQNGRDTHIRQVKIYGPRTSPEAMIGQGMQFSSAEFAQFATVR